MKTLIRVFKKRPQHETSRRDFYMWFTGIFLSNVSEMNGRRHKLPENEVFKWRLLQIRYIFTYSVQLNYWIQFNHCYPSIMNSQIFRKIWDDTLLVCNIHSATSMNTSVKMLYYFYIHISRMSPLNFCIHTCHNYSLPLFQDRSNSELHSVCVVKLFQWE